MILNIISYIVFLVIISVIGRWFGVKISQRDRLQGQNESKVGAEVSNQYLFALMGVFSVGFVGHWIAGERWIIDSHTPMNNGLATPLISSLPILLTFIVGGSGVVFGAWPTIRQLSGSNVSKIQKSVYMTIFLLIGYIVFLSSRVFTFPANFSTDILFILIYLIFIIFIYINLSNIWIRGRQPREPTTAENKQIRRVTTELGIEFDDIVICEVDGFTGAIWFLGVFGSPRLIVYEDFLNNVKEPHLKVALAEAFGRYENNILEYIIIEIFIGTLYIFSIIGLISHELPIWAGAITIAVILWMALKSTKLSYELDEKISEQFEAETVVEAYERHGDVMFTSRTTPDRLAFLQPIPSAKTRTERLRERFEIE